MSVTAKNSTIDRVVPTQHTKWNVSLITNLVALAIFLVSYVTPLFSSQIRSVGLFALSGALTNWLAIHMLFEKVPGLYGSGIIPLRFKEFKASIYELTMKQFFSEVSIGKFFQETSSTTDQKKIMGDIANSLDYDLLYNKLISAIIESPLGGMLSMIGGESFLEPVKPQLIAKMQQAIEEMIGEESFVKLVQEKFQENIDSSSVRYKVEKIINNRLDELTPEMVKEIIQDMIKEHLGWLVIWGGVFGGLIGLFASIVQ